MNAAGRINLFEAYKHMSTVQSNRAPDLLNFDDERNGEGEKTGFQVAKIGAVQVRVAPFSNDSVIITQADLRRLVKENHRMGWSAHRMHVENSLKRCLTDLEA